MRGRFLLAVSAMAMVGAAPPTQPIAAIKEFATYCSRGTALWGETLCGPIILVDPQTRAAISSEDPKLVGFAARDGLWMGALPASTSIANTSIELGGRRFAEILLPLPDDPIERRILFAHESFHRMQPDLGFHGQEADNGHLDAKDGRVFARLETAALKKALASRDWRPAARDALAYRAARLALYPNAESAEAGMIANEGVAEYTGVKVGAGREAAAYALQRLDSVTNRPSLIRSFGYVVGPAYGMLLDRTSSDWRRAALQGRPLPELLTEAIGLPPARSIAGEQYGRGKIVAEESARDLKIQQRRAALTTALVAGPTVTFPFAKMNIDFNPQSLFSLGDEGTVYSRATVRDQWGALRATGDVLVSSSWSFARVPGPATVNGQMLSGPDWTAELAPGYVLVAGNRTGDLIVKKQ